MGANGVNKAIVMGRLGRDPEMRRLASGDPVVNLRLATGETWKDKLSGERKERTDWHSVTIYNEGLCKVAEQYLKKGDQVYIEGEMRTRKYQHSDGSDRYTTEVVLDRFNGTLRLIGGNGGERRAAEPSEYGTQRTREGSGGDTRSGGGGGGRPNFDLDDDIPF